MHINDVSSFNEGLTHVLLPRALKVERQFRLRRVGEAVGFCMALLTTDRDTESDEISLVHVICEEIRLQTDWAEKFH